MNPFESTLITALRDEAQEIAMSTDLNDGREVLDSRLDAVDKGRRRTRWWGTFAVAAVVLAALAFVVLRPAAPPEPPPASGVSDVRYDGSAFLRPFQMNLPAWVAEVMTTPTDESREHVVFNRCAGDPDCIGLDAYAFTYLPDRAGVADPAGLATYDGLLASYEALASSGHIVMYDRQEVEIGGRDATTFSVTTIDDSPNALGCYADGACESFYVRNEDRYALIDAANGPLLIGLRSFADNPNNAEWLPQLAPSLATLTLPEAGDAAIPRELVGTWSMPVIEARVKSTLTKSGLGSHYARVAEELQLLPATQEFRMYVDSQYLRLYRVSADGVEEMVDAHTCSRSADLLVCVAGESQGTQEVLVLRYSLTGSELGLSFVSDAGEATIADIPNEALERALYTSSTWVRSTT